VLSVWELGSRKSMNAAKTLIVTRDHISSTSLTMS
jgi:hypothetical protein